MNKPMIGIRPITDNRRRGAREAVEPKAIEMANAAKKVIEENLFYPDGTHVECVIADSCIGGAAEAAACADKFMNYNICGTLSVTPSWCYGSETIDLDPTTVKAIWGYNATQRPGAVYLAAAMAAHAQYGLPVFSIYGHKIQDPEDPEVMPDEIKEKILRFARCAIAVGMMKNKSYVSMGSVSMGIAGCMVDPVFMQNYFGIRAEWVDMVEVLRRMDEGIYDKEEVEKQMKWMNEKCKVNPGLEVNRPEYVSSPEKQEEEWEFCAKLTCIVRDIMLGNPKLAEMGFDEEAQGRNAIAGGFQGQRMWNDYKPNADYTETILNSTFDWNGKRAPFIFATENDCLNAMSMLFLNLLTQQAAIFSDVRSYWGPESVKEFTGYELTGKAANGFIHMINSGASALDGTGAAKDENGTSIMKKWWDMTDKDIEGCLANTKWGPANKVYFRGGGFSSQYSCGAEMPVTCIRINRIEGLGPVIQIAEGYTVTVPEDVNQKILMQTDPTWPSLYFAPILTGEGPFTDVYSVMANWGANHGAFTYGHIGDDIITLASMLRIPVNMHNVSPDRIYRPHTWSAFGTADLESADYRACATYGPLYK